MVLLFYYLSLLNLADAFLTVVGIENSLITEANPLMERLYSLDLSHFILIKLSLSLALLLFIFYKKVPESQIVKALTLFAAICYTFVFGLHGFWLVRLI
ncbi:DUF5658 family protein [Heyndrickxia sp. MSNUG]|uniref:DUF5658 family protein n=1 Tax=Heyndrickxia sp. MSNUG TaxID=3136677 RepID=UPI003C2ADE1C